MKNLVDLHVHSCYSDGDLTPNELIKLAKAKGINTISITDHDTLLGNHNISIELDDMKIITGIELSAKTYRGRMHILGYGIDINNPNLNKKMEELRNNSINSVLSIIEQIKKDYGIFFTYKELKELINANHNLGRPDIARLCVNNGYANSVQDAFDKYLIDAYSKIRSYTKGLPYEECFSLILQSGGIPVLAHPNTLERNETELLMLIEEMIGYGLQGIEVYHSDHLEVETNRYLEIANKYNLLISGGSDFHGESVKPDIEIGTGKKNNILIKKLSILERIGANK